MTPANTNTSLPRATTSQPEADRARTGDSSPLVLATVFHFPACVAHQHRKPNPDRIRAGSGPAIRGLDNHATSAGLGGIPTVTNPARTQFWSPWSVKGGRYP